jgi:hypothetical protein
VAWGVIGGEEGIVASGGLGFFKGGRGRGEIGWMY